MALMLLTAQASAFSLLGPYADWMDRAKGYQSPADIGGPMNIGEGYRWNMPAVTYGFERSFLDYFGSNGVTAVESAIQILNQLPTASEMNLQNYPSDVWMVNFPAQGSNLLDLKSQALALLLEQMGLAEPERYTFCVRDFTPSGSNYQFFVMGRNFDPSTGSQSSYVNSTLFSYVVQQYAVSPQLTNTFCDAVEFPVDPFMHFDTTAAGRVPGLGLYLTNLSRDDAGGLRYLLNAGQIRFESLPADVQLAGTSTNDLVRNAYRPGVEKITFLRHPAWMPSGELQPFTNRWTDVYYAGDQLAYQEVQRVMTRPDIVFTAQDLGVLAPFARTGTKNWVNNADFNGNWEGAGPGVIQPPVVITFNNAGPFRINFSPFMDEATSILLEGWGSFDGSTNQPVRYPSIQTSFQPTQVRLRLSTTETAQDFSWRLPGSQNGLWRFQTSTNMQDWVTLASLTNSGAAVNYEHTATDCESCRFFRVIPQN